MSSYYEVLSISPTATTIEVQVAIDNLYNEWRQAVTHPDPTMVEKANRNLRLLEEMRTTLTDPAKRMGYDAGIGLGGPVGLADPAAVRGQAPSPPPRPKKSAGQSGGGAAHALWVCPKCDADNPPQTKHCFNCGTQLVRACPNCNEMSSLVASGFCGNCGANYDQATRLAELRQEKVSATGRVNAASTAVANAQQELNSLAAPQQKIISSVLVAILIGWPVNWTLGLLGLSFGSPLFYMLAFGLIFGAMSFAKYSSAKREYNKSKAVLEQKLAAQQLQLSEATEHLAATETELDMLEQRLRV